MSRRVVFLTLLSVLISLPSLAATRDARSLDLRFEANNGQLPGDVQFALRGGAKALFRRNEVVFAGNGSGAAPVSLRFAHVSSIGEVSGEGRVPGVSNFYLGSDASGWREGVPSFSRVRYRDAWPGIDVLFHGRDGVLELDLEVDAGADPSAAVFSVTGAKTHLDQSGDLVIGRGQLRLRRPVAFQSTRVLSARFVPRRGGQFIFDVSGRDPSLPLTIDPVISFSTYLGGSVDDNAARVAVDATGNIYVLGETTSANFPVSASASQGSTGGSSDLFITKYAPGGASIIYSTYLGGSGDENVTDTLVFHSAGGIASDASGNAYIAATTWSTDAPTTAGALRSTNAGASDALVAKLGPTGALLFSTYFGGSSMETPRGLAIDPAGAVYLCGHTESANFPVSAGALQPTGILTGGIVWDGFVAKLSPGGGSISYSTFLGGNANDHAVGIAVDSQGFAYVTGGTVSTDFPTVNALQPALASNWDSFVAKLNQSGSAFVYSTYLGGNVDDYAHGIAIDGSGNAFVTGATGSSTFPTTPGALKRTNNGGDAYVTRINAAGTLGWSTFLGGYSWDESHDIAVDVNGEVVVGGWTYSVIPTTFPFVNPTQSVSGGGNHDAFVSRLSASGSSLTFSTLLGGNGEEQVNGVAVDSERNIIAVGRTTSTNFTSVSPAQAANGGSFDAFVTIYRVSPAGDVSGDGTVTSNDVIYLINFLLGGGPGPVGNGDVNKDGAVDINDVFYLINYLFAGGPAPTA